MGGAVSIIGNIFEDVAVKAPCVVGTTGANIVLSGVQTIDGVVVGNNGERVLVKDQNDNTTNGLYTAQTSAWTRTSDASKNTDFVTGTQVLVTGGAQNPGLTFVMTCTDAPVVLGTSKITWETEQEFSAQGLLATSATSYTIAPGVETFTTQSGKPFAPGQWVSISSRANPLNYMTALVTSYSGTQLGVYVAIANGSGMHSDWNIAVSGAPGAQGLAGQPQLFDTVALATAATIPASVNYVRTAGYAIIGIGGALYKKVASQPTDPRRFNSADGAWWQATPASTLDLATLGAGQGSQTTDDAALGAAVTYANTLGGKCRIYWPDGVYTHGVCSVALVNSNVSFEAESRGGVYIDVVGSGAFLSIGSSSASLTAHIVIRNLDLDWGNSPSTSCIAFALANVLEVRVEDSFFSNFQQIAQLGTVGNAGTNVADFFFEGCFGVSANGGVAAFALNHGEGLYAFDCVLYVPISNPTHGSPQATTVGTDLFKSVNGDWDTALITNSLFQFFDTSFDFSAEGSGVIIDFFVEHCILANCKSYVFNLVTTAGGAIGQFRVNNNWIECWEQVSVAVNNNGGFNDNHRFSGNLIMNSGKSNFWTTGYSVNNVFEGNRVACGNQTGANNPAIWMQGPCTGWSIRGNLGNTDDSGSIAAWRCPVGIQVDANCDLYDVSDNRMLGSSNSYIFGTNTSGSKQRRCTNNSYADATLFGGYAGIASGSLGLGSYNNFTPFVQELILEGGAINTITIAGVTITMPTSSPFVPPASYRLEPGESLIVLGLTVPNLTVRTCA